MKNTLNLRNMYGRSLIIILSTDETKEQNRTCVVFHVTCDAALMRIHFCLMPSSRILWLWKGICCSFLAHVKQQDSQVKCVQPSLPFDEHCALLVPLSFFFFLKRQ